MPNYVGVKNELMYKYKREIEEVVKIPVAICEIYQFSIGIKELNVNSISRLVCNL